MQDLIPPHDIACEEALLGGILIDDAGYNEISINENDFYHEIHRFIFKAFINLNQTKTHIDEKTVSDEINRMGKLEAIGGVSTLMRLQTCCPSPMDVYYYAEIVKRLSICRQLIVVGAEIQ